MGVYHYKRAANGLVHLAATKLNLFGPVGSFCPVANWSMQTMIVTVAYFGQIGISLIMMQCVVIFASPK